MDRKMAYRPFTGQSLGVIHYDMDLNRQKTGSPQNTFKITNGFKLALVRSRIWTNIVKSSSSIIGKGRHGALVSC